MDRGCQDYFTTETQRFHKVHREELCGPLCLLRISVVNSYNRRKPSAAICLRIERSQRVLYYHPAPTGADDAAR